jgi:hypothetical protein
MADERTYFARLATDDDRSAARQHLQACGVANVLGERGGKSDNEAADDNAD